jgi:hypothetical protein
MNLFSDILNNPQEKLHVCHFVFNAVNAAIIFDGTHSITTASSPNASFKLSQINHTGMYLFVVYSVTVSVV